MGHRPDHPTWQTAFAAGLLLRPLLILPMVPGGPLSSSPLLPFGLIAVLAGHLLLAGGVALGIRVVVVLGILTAIAGIPVAAVGVAAGLPMPWPVVMAVYNVGLAAVGVTAWRRLPPTT